MPGVRAILTGADTSELGPMPCVVGVPGQKMIVPPCPVLALDEVHHVGDAVAFVVADTLDQARDAAEAIEIEWDALPHVIGAEAALAPRRAAGLAGPAGQSRVRSDLRRPCEDRGGVRESRARGRGSSSSTSGW